MTEQYQVLARKWRPKQFADVIGQEHVTTTLRNAIEQNRLAHAYLFVGPRGIGKTSTARIFAKALNCVKGPRPVPCDTCDNCIEIAEGRSLDVLEIDGASNNGVEQVRELRETCRYTPARSRFKLYIIDEVHMLTTAAFNALLKTLEEPPAHVKFLFATTEPQKVLPTILSRCQRFDLRRIPAALIVQHLKTITGKEKVSIDDKALAAIARGAEGGLRDAESVLDQLIAFCGNRITESDVLSVFGLVAHDQVAALTDAVLDGDTNRALTVLKQLDEVGKDLQRLLADLLEHFRNLLVVCLGGNAAAPLELADTEAGLLAAQAARTDADTVLRIIEVLVPLEGRLRYALSKRIFFEIALVKAIKSRELTGLDGVLKKLNDLRSQLAGGEPAGRPASVPANPPQRAAATGAGGAPRPAASLVEERSAPARAAAAAPSLAEAWAGAVEHLSNVSQLAGSYLAGARPIGAKGEVIVIGFDPEFPERFELADTARNREVLQTKLRELLRRDVSLKFELDAAVAPAPAPPAPAPSRSTTRAAAAPPGAAGPEKKSPDDFRDDPLIRKALEIFKGNIVDVRK